MPTPVTIRKSDLQRIVVAIDPAVTSNEGSDETGIIVAGLGRDSHGYVLEDLSCRASPEAWARVAVLAYHRWRADRIVAEANQGGDMVSLVLHTVDANVPVKLVHAARGKVARAEPVAALYEQAKCHHVGTFPGLEDQMATWTQGDASPDRLDALVWALTELMLGERRVPLADEPMLPTDSPESSLIKVIQEAQKDPFSWADQHTSW